MYQAQFKKINTLEFTLFMSYHPSIFCQNINVCFYDCGTLKHKMKNQYKTLNKKQIKHNLVYIQRHLLSTVINLFTCKLYYVIYYLLLNWIFNAITLLLIFKKTLLVTFVYQQRCLCVCILSNSSIQRGT